jgi:hypothetical protein
MTNDEQKTLVQNIKSAAAANFNTAADHSKEDKLFEELMNLGLALLLEVAVDIKRIANAQSSKGQF